MTKAQLFVAIFIVMFAIIGWKGYTLYQATLPKLLLQWDVANEDNLQAIDHRLWGDILTKYVHLNINNERTFDYDNVSKNDKAKLTRYLYQLQKVDPRNYRRNEQLAYWVNLYNALIVDLALTHFPLKSIKDVGDGFTGPWNIKIANVANMPITLNNIEHGILRPLWQDMRIHYVINCGSIGCPDVPEKPFSSIDIDNQLDLAARRFINQKKGVMLNDNVLVLSSIYDWFAVDFGEDQQALLLHLMRHAEPVLKQKLKLFNGKTEFFYNWKLNGLSAGLHSRGSIGDQANTQPTLQQEQGN